MSEVPEKQPHTLEEFEIAYGSNAIRLNARQWLAVALLFLAVFIGIPIAWEHVEDFQPGPDYRIPYVLGNDYWHFARYARYAARQDAILAIGDSVVWGEYVTPDHTLPQHLNETLDGDRFLNLGVNGIHPAALAGLVKYYGRAIKGHKILLHYNALWMTSPRHDLQTEKEFRFNHPKLVPQFLTKIPCYKDPYTDRFGIVAERYMPFRGWTNHLSIAYLDNTAPPLWVIQNPYKLPFSSIDGRLPEPGTAPRHGEPLPWNERGMAETPFEWVAASQSLQWRLFREAAKTLLDRGNEVFVLVGPFNEHMIAPESQEGYRAIKRDIEQWLTDEAVPHLVAEVLPSECYADASHPMSEGYALLAEELKRNQAFASFIGGPGAQVAQKGAQPLIPESTGAGGKTACRAAG